MNTKRASVIAPEEFERLQAIRERMPEPSRFKGDKFRTLAYADVRQLDMFICNAGAYDSGIEEWAKTLIRDKSGTEFWAWIHVRTNITFL